MSKMAYFFECYLIPGTDLNNLEEVVSEFLHEESIVTINQLKSEIKDILKNEKWHYAINVIKSNSGYVFDVGAVKEFVKDISLYLK